MLRVSERPSKTCNKGTTFRATFVARKVVVASCPIKITLGNNALFMDAMRCRLFGLYRGILVYNVCLISISNSVSDGATNKSVLNIESS